VTHAIDPTSSKGDHVDEADVGKQNTKDGRLSEHDQKFQWPPAAEVRFLLLF
jgi:hypothetical protein